MTSVLRLGRLRRRAATLKTNVLHVVEYDAAVERGDSQQSSKEENLGQLFKQAYDQSQNTPPSPTSRNPALGTLPKGLAGLVD